VRLLAARRPPHGEERTERCGGVCVVGWLGVRRRRFGFWKRGREEAECGREGAGRRRFYRRREAGGLVGWVGWGARGEREWEGDDELVGCW
jgi:hypothetical protein